MEFQWLWHKALGSSNLAKGIFQVEILRKPLKTLLSMPTLLSNEIFPKSSKTAMPCYNLSDNCATELVAF